MKVLIYNIDEGGLKTYSRYLLDGLKKFDFDAHYADKINYKKFDIVHVMFDYSIFHPWGLGVIPSLARLKLNGKKIILTFGVVQPKKGIYARNKVFTLIKKIILPMTHRMLDIFSDKMIVMLPHLKGILVKDYKISPKKVAVIAHGMY
jgi:hypothetical protein